MTEWRLFPEGTVPEFTTFGFFDRHPWVPPGHQAGHAERTAMVATLVEQALAGSTSSGRRLHTWSDLGCGDGALLSRVSAVEVLRWGYDAGAANVAQARLAGLDVSRADVLVDPLDYGELITTCEMIEHLVDPHAFLRGLPRAALILSSPSAETDAWHYVHHAWAWDLDGYAALVRDCGWSVLDQVECDAPDNIHNGVAAPQRFQAILAERASA